MDNYNIDKQIEKALSREPDFKLPHTFADQLISMIEEARKKEQRWEIFWMSLGGFLFLIALVVVFAVTDFSPSLNSLSFLSNHFGLIAFGVLFVALLHLIDKKVTHKVQGN